MATLTTTRFAKPRLKFFFRWLRHQLRDRLARPHAKRQIALLKSNPRSAFNCPSVPGYMRGIDFYDEFSLIAAVKRAMANYRRSHGHYPNLLTPAGLNEKIIWSKFFSPLKIPESGNKLMTASFIPRELVQTLSTPEVIWRCRTPVLPANSDIQPGAYYLKTNHGSNMYRRIRYPLTWDDRLQLETLCREWLDTDYGLVDGEWWYNTFRKEIFLERDVVGTPYSISYNFFVFHGNIESIVLHQKGKPGTRGTGKSTRLAPDFSYQQDISKNSNLEVPSLPDRIKESMRRNAELVGRQFGFARIDFFVGADETVYLGEITFAPGNGLIRRPQELDLKLGSLWHLQPC